jgi:two-component system cell cycle sensor histidine kinase/response regulator CckA
VRGDDEAGDNQEVGWRAIASHLPYVVYVFDLGTQRAAYVNRSIARELGYEADQHGNVPSLGDDPLRALLHPDDFARLPELLARWDHAADGEVLEAEIRLLHRDGGYRWFRGRDVVLERSASGRVRTILGTWIEVTWRKELEAELARTAALEAVGRLAGGVAHDFNNLLTVMLAALAMARRTIERGGDPASHLQQLGEALGQAKDVTRQLLGFARSQPTRRERVPLDRLVEEAAPAIRRLIEEDVSITYELGLEGSVIEVDRSHFTKLLAALCARARDAMPEGGQLLVRTFVRDGGAVLSVEDSALGARLVEPDDPGAARPSAAPSGPGAGDTIERVRRVVGLDAIEASAREQGATVSSSYEPGASSKVEVTFPIAAALVAVSPVAGDRRVVLLAEDNEMLARAVQGLLESAGIETLLARDGVEALELWEQHRASIGLVLTDVVLPRLGGDALAARLMAADPTLVVLRWSGYPRSPEKTDPAPRALFVRKPLAPDELVSLVTRLLSEAALVART